MIQFIIDKFPIGQIIYNYRLNYDLIKDRPANIEIVLKEVSSIITKEKLRDYVVILGDSVSYSGPGPFDTSIGYYLNKKAEKAGKDFKVFNLSIPAAQVGDFYTLLLKMDQYGISRDNIIINVVYAGFVERNPEPPPVYWLGKQLADMDPGVYGNTSSVKDRNIKEQLLTMFSIRKIKNKLKDKLYETLPIYKYKDCLQVYAKDKLSRLKGRLVSADEPVQPWYTKPFLKDLLMEYQYQMGFNPAPFVMDSTNPQIYFLDKIIGLQGERNTLIYLAPINDKLVGEYLDYEKYFENIRFIDKYFAQKPVEYVNYYGKMPYDLFSDHIHYTFEGYEYLSDLLWDGMQAWGLP